MGLTNHTRPLSHHIMPLVLVFNALGVETHTYTPTDTHMHTQRDRYTRATHTYQRANKSDFKKPGVCLKILTAKIQYCTSLV